jgi:uncharacterized repeat protein (TIGR01451 family)
LTEELLFNPSAPQLTNPAANWASFEFMSFGVDNVAPTLSCPVSGTTGTNGWYTSAVSESCSATDDRSGFASGATAITGTKPPVLQGPLMTTLPTVTTGSSQGAVTIPKQTISDLAGNSASSGPATYDIDSIAPKITAAFSASGSTFLVGQTVTLKYTCTDSGSGIANCGGQAPPTACPTAPGAGLASYSYSVAIPTTVTQVGKQTINTSAVDCAGNTTPFSISYTIAYGAADLLVATIAPTSVKTGTNLSYQIVVLNLGPNTADNLVVSTPVPSGTTYVSAVSGTGTCTLAGKCSEIASGTSCGLTSGVVTCSIATLKPITSLTGFVVNLVVNVTAPANSTIKDVATATESNPDPLPLNDPSTRTTNVTH